MARVRVPCFSERIFERLGVIVPIFAFLVIGFADLPLARRIVESLREPGELFLLGNMEKKFEDRGVTLSSD